MTKNLVGLDITQYLNKWCIWYVQTTFQLTDVAHITTSPQSNLLGTKKTKKPFNFTQNYDIPMISTENEPMHS